MSNELVLVEKIAQILYRWDPVKLHSPKEDEYKSEAFDIIYLWTTSSIRPISWQELHRGIYLIFTLSFGVSQMNYSSRDGINHRWVDKFDSAEKIIGGIETYECLTKEIWNLLCYTNNGKENI